MCPIKWLQISWIVKHIYLLIVSCSPYNSPKKCTILLYTFFSGLPIERKQGCLFLRYKVFQKSHVKTGDNDPSRWQEKATCGPEWRLIVKNRVWDSKSVNWPGRETWRTQSKHPQPSFTTLSTVAIVNKPLPIRLATVAI